jgi:Fe-S-cluster-containing dehydrogenase component/DMSO reductase anchor subunit
MRNGFLFDSDLCVNCKACVAACRLENGFQTETRTVFVYNKDFLPDLNLLNLSLACNHCSDPLCLTGCPAKAYSNDKEYGLVIHDPEKCMGCGFCTWRCPFDAPKMNFEKGHIEKCSYCIERTRKGIEPACSSACPTGALKSLRQDEFAGVSSLIPETRLKPSVIIKGREGYRHPEIYPEEQTPEMPVIHHFRDSLFKEWSLILFTFLVTLSVALAATEYSGGFQTGYTPIFFMLIAALTISFTHLGSPLKSWRAVININASPLSREIAMVSLFTVAVFLNIFINSFSLQLMTILCGIFALADIDALYFSTDKSLSVKLHSGQTLFSAFLLFFALSGYIKLFALLSMLAAGSVIFSKQNDNRNKNREMLLYIRLALLAIPLVLILLKTYLNNYLFEVSVLSGIFIDRVIFYADFKSLNIRHYLEEKSINDYEKARRKRSQNTNLP